jgi:hypothetical protein
MTEVWFYGNKTTSGKGRIAGFARKRIRKVTANLRQGRFVLEKWF